MSTFSEFLNENLDKFDKFVSTIYALGIRSGDGVKIRVNGIFAYVELISFSNVVHITEISIDQEEQMSGAGTSIMKLITGLADKQKVKLDLFPNPIQQSNGSSISKPKLIEFYKKHGFVMKGRKMEREPRNN